MSARRKVKAMQTIEELIRQLPPDLQQEVIDFAKFLMQKRQRKASGELKLDWRGALRDMRDEYTSVELQHRLVEWWGD